MEQKINNRTDAIKFLIEKHGYKSYLEVGVQYKENWDKITCERKQGVEPNNVNDELIHPITSDMYFAEFDEKFDIIFIDGNHNYGQVIKDFYNALSRLNEGGCIVFHDALPYCKEYTNEFHCGTVYKALLEVRSMHDFGFVTYEEDHGVCVIMPSKKSPKIECRHLEWEAFYPRRVELLNVRGWDEFVKYF